MDIEVDPFKIPSLTSWVWGCSMKISETLAMFPAMLIAKIVSRTEATIFNNVDIPEINMM